MGVWFSSDWHLGHKYAAYIRGFGSVEEHDDAIISSMNNAMAKNDKLFLLGDVAFSMAAIEKLKELKVKHRDLVLGNHDRLNTQVYLKYFRRCEGAVIYGNFLLTHVPVLAQEIVARVQGNICGHIHDRGLTSNVHWPWFNVNVEFWGFRPIPFEYIEEIRLANLGEREEAANSLRFVTRSEED